MKGFRFKDLLVFMAQLQEHKHRLYANGAEDDLASFKKVEEFTGLSVKDQILPRLAEKFFRLVNSDKDESDFEEAVDIAVYAMFIAIQATRGENTPATIISMDDYKSKIYKVEPVHVDNSSDS